MTTITHTRYNIQNGGVEATMVVGLILALISVILFYFYVLFDTAPLDTPTKIDVETTTPTPETTPVTAPHTATPIEG